MILTTEAILAEPASRQMDAWVAVYVFGWRWRRSKMRGLCTLQPPRGGGWSPCPWGPRLYAAVKGWPTATEMFADWDLGGRYRKRGDRHSTRRGIPYYSTDIADAWAVVARVQQRNPGWRFSVLGGDSPFPSVFPKRGKPTVGKDRVPFGWHAEFFGHEDPRLCTGQRHGEAYAGAVPLAVCRAALLAVLKEPT